MGNQVGGNTRRKKNCTYSKTENTNMKKIETGVRRTVLKDYSVLSISL